QLSASVVDTSLREVGDDVGGPGLRHRLYAFGRGCGPSGGDELESRAVPAEFPAALGNSRHDPPELLRLPSNGDPAVADPGRTFEGGLGVAADQDGYGDTRHWIHLDARDGEVLALPSKVFPR